MALVDAAFTLSGAQPSESLYFSSLFAGPAGMLALLARGYLTIY
ncbi:MAG: hypothetical protein RLZZ15_2359 [Verrucomicrobiota bacterium]|jgi:hypothetical protein